VAGDDDARVDVVDRDVLGAGAGAGVVVGDGDADLGDVRRPGPDVVEELGAEEAGAGRGGGGDGQDERARRGTAGRGRGGCVARPRNGRVEALGLQRYARLGVRAVAGDDDARVDVVDRDVLGAGAGAGVVVGDGDADLGDVRRPGPDVVEEL